MNRCQDKKSKTHVLVWRGGKATIVSYKPGGLVEDNVRPFDNDHAAIAHLATLSGW